MLAFFVCAKHGCRVKVCSRHVNWTKLNRPERFDPVTRRVHWSRASASRLHFVSIVCSETRTVSARLVLNKRISLRPFTTEFKPAFSSVRVLWTGLNGRRRRQQETNTACRGNDRSDWLTRRHIKSSVMLWWRSQNIIDVVRMSLIISSVIAPPTGARTAAIRSSVRPSVCLFMPLYSSNCAFEGYGCYETLIGNPMIDNNNK